MAGYKKRTAIQYYKDLLTGDALKRTENKFNPDKRQKLSEWHQDHYIKRKDSLKTGSQFAPKGDSAKKYIKGGFDAMIDTARQQNSAKAKIKKVKNLQNVARVGTGAAGALALGAGAYGINKLKNSKKEEIEKVAQARWRKHIDSLQTEDELMDFASNSSRNKRQIFDKPGNMTDRKNIGFNKDEMKRVLSSDRGWAFEDGSMVPTNVSLRDMSKNKREHLQDMLEDKDFNKQLALRRQRREMSKANKIVDGVYRNLLGPESKSTSMNAPGQVPEAGPDDLISIIHGGNKAKAEAFIRGGNGLSELQTRELLHDGTMTNTGLQFHSKNRSRAPEYARMQANNSGTQAVIEAKVPRKYMYVNTSQSNISDEMGLPDAYFNKMQDIKVYNPETGQVYLEMDNNKNALPYGRTRTPGVPSTSERMSKIHKNNKGFVMQGEGKLGGAPIVKDRLKESFKESINAQATAQPIPTERALVPVSNNGFTMGQGGSVQTPKRPMRQQPQPQAKPQTQLLLSAPQSQPQAKPKLQPKAVTKQGLSKNTKLGLGLGAGALALGAGAYGLKKLKDKHQEKNANTIEAMSEVHGTDYKEQIEKVARDNGIVNTNDNKISKKDVALAGASLGAIGASKNMLLGKKTMYHGTSKENWDKIKNQGLFSDRGGFGGASQAIGNTNYVDLSKNNVHLSRFKPVANLYSNDVNNMGPASMLRQGKNGKTMRISMDYDKFKKMRIDNAGSDDISNIPKALRGVAKNMAAKGNVDISPEEIIGSSAKLKDRLSHTAKALPGYIKNNPARFGGGLALAGAGAYGLKKLKDNHQEKNANTQTHYELEIEKFSLGLK